MIAIIISILGSIISGMILFFVQLENLPMQIVLRLEIVKPTES